MLPTAFARFSATVPAVMTAKVVGKDEAGVTTVAVTVVAITKVEVDVVVDVAAETMRHEVDRDLRRPRSFFAP